MDAENLAMKNRCWVCKGSQLTHIKKSNIERNVSSKDFTITDSNYGTTASIYKCHECGFLQCSDFEDVLPYYEQLEDPVYDDSRRQRALQQKKILHQIKYHKKNGSLLDIGASSGILVEQALKMGFDAEGVEPSVYLHKKATKLGLPVHLGKFNSIDFDHRFDIITLIDIIEHITTPMEMMNEVHAAMKDDGIGMIVTPDAGSIMAKLLKNKWWHYRIAHIGYFQKKSLLLMLEKTGFVPIEVRRPGWYFSGDYLVERLNVYLPPPFKLPQIPSMEKVTIPLNLLDSLLVLFRKK